MTRPRQSRQFDIGVLAIGKGGPRPITESVPTDNRAREEVAVRKFSGSLQTMLARTLTDIVRPRPRADWPDFTAAEGDRRWAIEVTEVVEQVHAAQAHLEASYQEALAESLFRHGAPSPGVQIRVAIGRGGHRIPRLESPQGQHLLRALLSTIESEWTAASRLSIGKFRVAKITAPIHSTVFCLRTMPGYPLPVLSVAKGYDLDADKAAAAVARAIQRKIDQNYASTAEHKMLLLYTYRAFPAGVDPEEYALSRSVLHGHPGHFHEVWHCWLMPDGLVSPITQVWPSKG